MASGVDDLLADFRGFLNEACITHGVAMHGLDLVEAWWRDAPSAPGNPDPLFALAATVGPPASPSDTYARIRKSRLLEMLDRATGSARETLDHQWIVSTYTAWEHDFRPELAAAHGCAKDDVKHPVLGDLRLLRNDVVHHRGVVTASNAGSCQVLRWFGPGERIRLDARRLQEFMDAFPWEPLRQRP